MWNKQEYFLTCWLMFCIFKGKLTQKEIPPVITALLLTQVTFSNPHQQYGDFRIPPSANPTDAWTGHVLMRCTETRFSGKPNFLTCKLLCSVVLRAEALTQSLLLRLQTLWNYGSFCSTNPEILSVSGLKCFRSSKQSHSECTFTECCPLSKEN